MKKVDLVDGEQMVIKSADGTEFIYDENGLHRKDEPQTKISVLKSMRTEAGAQDWIRLAGKEEDARVVDAQTLKGMHEDYGDMEMGYHVIVEEPMDVGVFDDGEFRDILRAMCDSGYVEFDDMGPMLTDKWWDGVQTVMRDAISNVLKSMNDIDDAPVGNLSATQQEFISNLHQVTKSLEDSESLARMSGAPEEDDTGHPRRPEEPISDGEVTTAEQRGADDVVPGGGGADTSDPNKEGDDVSDEEVDTATHLGDHNEGDAGASHDDMRSEMDSHKSVEEDEIVDTTFKSLAAAREWKNPDPESYHVVPTSFDDKKKYGRNKSYIVKPRAPKEIFGAHGNKIV